MSMFITPAISALIAIITLILGKDYIVQHDANANSIKVVNSNGQTVADIPLSLKPVRFFKSGLGRTSSILIAKPVGSPQIQFTNPYKDRKVTVVNISLVPDATFKLHGICEVDINGRSVLDPITAGSFTDITDFQVPIPEEGVVLDEGQTIDVYVWSDNSANTVNLTASFGVVAQ